MAKRKPTEEKPSSKDRHRHPAFQMRLHSALRAQLEKLCERNASELSEEVRIAIRKHLEAHELWPPTD